MHPDIAERRGSQNCVGNGVREHIGVGVTHQTELARYGNAA